MYSALYLAVGTGEYYPWFNNSRRIYKDETSCGIFYKFQVNDPRKVRVILINIELRGLVKYLHVTS